MKKPRQGQHIPWPGAEDAAPDGAKNKSQNLFYKYAAPTALLCPQKPQRILKILRQRRFKTHLPVRMNLGSAPASGAANDALVVGTDAHKSSDSLSSCSARGRAEPQPGRPRSPEKFKHPNYV
jgi:hypothetical protein